MRVMKGARWQHKYLKTNNLHPNWISGICIYKSSFCTFGWTYGFPMDAESSLSGGLHHGTMWRVTGRIDPSGLANQLTELLRQWQQAGSLEHPDNRDRR